MKTIPYNKFKHGQRVKYCINGQIISSAKIIKDKDTVYVSPYNIAICWDNVEYYEEKSSVKNLQFLPRTLDDLEEGDIVLKTGDEWKILGICGDVYFMSICNNFKRTGTFLTKEELKDEGYTLKQEEEEEEKESVDSAYFYITQDKNKITYDGKTYILSKYL